jgi:hypothetical protein
MPDEFEKDGRDWIHANIGWRVNVGWTSFEHQIRPSEHIDAIAPSLPSKYSPLRMNGHGLQGVYLTEIPPMLMHSLGKVIGTELMTALSQPAPSLVEQIGERSEEVYKLKNDWENSLERQIENNTVISSTERETLIRSRRGQGLFRSRVSKIEHACRITHVENPKHLIASHTKPWRHCTNDERLDGENGLLLTPSVDHLFDLGFISFEDGGRLLVSPVADRQSLERMGVETERPVRVGDFSDGQKQYLDYHRNEIFLVIR